MKNIYNLKPCPFCGSENVHGYNASQAKYRQYNVKCMKCGARICKSTLAEAIATWNQRSESVKKEPNYTWHDTYFGRVGKEVLAVDDPVTSEIAYRVEAKVEYDIKKIIDIFAQHLEPFLYKDVPRFHNDFDVFLDTFDPMEQVIFRGQRLYKATGELTDWEKVKQHELIERIRKWRR